LRFAFYFVQLHALFVWHFTAEKKDISFRITYPKKLKQARNVVARLTLYFVIFESLTQLCQKIWKQVGKI
jgi:hypothetical protein